MNRFVLLLGLALLSACSTLPAHHNTATAASDSIQFEPDIAAFERADSVVRRMPGSVVFVSSSSIRLWDSLGEDFPGVAVINRGFGGSTVTLCESGKATEIAATLAEKYHEATGITPQIFASRPSQGAHVL